MSGISASKKLTASALAGVLLIGGLSGSTAQPVSGSATFSSSVAGIPVASDSVAGIAVAGPRPVSSSSSAGGPAHEVDTWTASADNLGDPYADKTVRDIVHTSIAGSQVRLRLSNAFGTKPVTFDSVYLGMQSVGAALVSGSNRQVTFGDSTSVIVPKGAEAVSDPVPMTVAPQTNLSVSIHVAGDAGEVTGHIDSQQDTYYSEGDTASSPSAQPFVNIVRGWFWLDAVTVDAPMSTGTVVALGDSITDGYQSTPNANHRWPDYLAARLLGSPTGQAGVANEGISGNKVTADGVGMSAQARLDRDVLSQPGVTTVVFLEGTNDIGTGVVTSAAQLIAADRQIISRTHARGLRILGGTITPFQGSGYYSADKEAIRQAVNGWIRTGGAFDGVVDFDEAVRNPSDPRMFLPAYDSGDHLHPDDAGYRAMANAVDLRLLAGPK